MDNSNHKKEIPPLTREQIWRLYQLSLMPDEEIDFSDIPEITPEEWKKFKPARLRKKNLQNAN